MNTDTYLSERLNQVKQNSSYYPDQADALYTWVTNTGECFKIINNARSQYLAGKIDIKQFTLVCLGQCIEQRQPLQRKEEDLGRLTLASCKAASLEVANYYLNVYQD